WIAAVAPFETRESYTLAERGYRAGIARWPQTALPYTALGNVHAARRDWLGAVEAYSEALARMAAPILLNNRAHALSQLGCIDAAQADLQQAMRFEVPADVRETLAQTHREVASRAPSAAECPP